MGDYNISTIVDVSPVASYAMTRRHLIRVATKFYRLEGDTLTHMIAFALIVSPRGHAGTCALSCCQ